jgi:DNA-binding NtrC family response regulator
MGAEASKLDPPLTVAIVSRDRVYRDSLAQPLRRFALRVRTLQMTASGEPADLEDVDVLVIDTDALSAGELAGLNRLHARWPLVEVVAVTGGLPVEEAVEALRAGVFTVLQHPVADRLLVETITQAGRRHRRARARLEELSRASYSTGIADDASRLEGPDASKEEVP